MYSFCPLIPNYLTSSPDITHEKVSEWLQFFKNQFSSFKPLTIFIFEYSLEKEIVITQQP